MSESTQNPKPTAHPADAPATTTQPVKGGRKRTFLFAGGAVLAAAVLAGGGVAIGAAIADDDDDLDNASLTSNTDDRAGSDADDDRTSGSDDSEASGNGAASDDAADDSADSSSASVSGATSADELSEIIAAAATVADGNAVGIDAERDGSWDVSFETSAGDETEVRVTADGTATVTSTEAAEADDTAPRGALDAKTVDALVAAALAEADGTITELDIDDDPTSPFDVLVLTADGRSVDIELDAQMKVLSVERD